MRHLFLLATAAAWALTGAYAQVPKAEYWIDWDNTAKRCTVVTANPTDKAIVGGGPTRRMSFARSLIACRPQPGRLRPGTALMLGAADDDRIGPD
jgi:hypothetical protein